MSNVAPSEQHSPQGRLPDFYIIGSAKSGTTTLYKELEGDSNVFFCSPKEPCFFDSDVAWSKGMDWYQSLFSSASSGQLCGEASTNYTRWPQVQDVPARIHEYTPQAKLIYIMRNPVKRAYSHYVHRWTKETHVGEYFTQSIREYVEHDPMCIDSGVYYDQLQQYLKYFDRSQICLVIFEELLAEEEKVFKAVYDFLGLDYAKKPKEELRAENVNEDFRYHMKRQQLIEGSKAIQVLRRYSRALVPKPVRQYLYDEVIVRLPSFKSIDKGFEPIPLSSQDRKWLEDVYKPHNKKLEDEFGVNTTLWKNS